VYLWGYKFGRAKDIVDPALKKSRLRQVPGGSYNNKIANIKRPVMDYEYSLSREDFLVPEWDLAEVGRIATAESYFSRAIRAKTALMTKQDPQLVGRNSETLQYIKSRFKQIGISTKVPFELLLWRTANDLIQYSNAMWVKVRQSKLLKGVRGRKVNEKTLDPVVGYFYLSPEMVEFLKPESPNEVVRYRQRIGDKYVDFPASDVVHFTYDKRGGLLIGMPQIIPAISDIELLRKLEENVATLVHKHLFPLFHYVVGTEQQPAKLDMKTGKDEVELVREVIEELPAEGSLFTDHRHKINVLGAEQKALKIEGYLEHFKLRVFAGLAISGIDVGETNTGNKATADSASRAMIDSVKDYQKVLEWQINQYIIQELLQESVLADKLDVLSEENIVTFRYPEIDIESRIKVQTHYLQAWLQNVTTLSETRGFFGLEPMSDKEWEDTYFSKVQKTLVELAAEQKASNQEAQSRGNDNVLRPANQKTKLTGPKKLKNSIPLGKFFDSKDGTFNHSTFYQQLLLSSLDQSLFDETDTYSIITKEHGTLSYILEQKLNDLYRAGLRDEEVFQLTTDAIYKSFIESLLNKGSLNG